MERIIELILSLASKVWVGKRELSSMEWRKDRAGNTVLHGVYAPLDASLPEDIGISAGNV